MYVAQCRLLAPRGPRTVPHGDAPVVLIVDARRERERERERERRLSGRGRDARKIYQPLCDFSARPQITRPPVVPPGRGVGVRTRRVHLPPRASETPEVVDFKSSSRGKSGSLRVNV